MPRVLARRGHRIRVAVRRPELAGHVKMYGSVGQIQPIQANLRNAASVRHAVQGADGQTLAVKLFKGQMTSDGLPDSGIGPGVNTG